MQIPKTSFSQHHTDSNSLHNALQQSAELLNWDENLKLADIANTQLSNTPKYTQPAQISITRLREALEFAKISDDVYFNKSSSNRLPNGVKRLTTTELNQLGQNLQLLLNSPSGYDAALYYDSKRDIYILANRGSDFKEFADLSANLRQGAGLLSKQYSDAISLAKTLKSKLGDKIKFTGHSLGGGIASAQALITNSQAITFNASGLHPNTVNMTTSALNSKAEKLVTAYFINGDILTGLQDNPFIDQSLKPVADTIKQILSTTSKRKQHDNGPDHFPRAIGERVVLQAIKDGQKLSTAESAAENLHSRDLIRNSLEFEINRR